MVWPYLKFIMINKWLFHMLLDLNHLTKDWTNIQLFKSCFLFLIQYSAYDDNDYTTRKYINPILSNSQYELLKRFAFVTNLSIYIISVRLKRQTIICRRVELFKLCFCTNAIFIFYIRRDLSASNRVIVQHVLWEFSL